VKKIEKEKQEIANQFSEYRNEKEESVTNYEARIKRIKDTLERQSETEH
jgi:hypothetical protein